MIGDYEDDTHFCLKCHSTIIGLDNYVTHRKAGCSKTVIDVPKSPLPSQLLPPDESFSLKADDFFSSLELQSSSKKLTPSKNLGILTRSKTSAVIQAASTSKDQQNVEIPQSKSGKNVWIGGHQLKLGYGDNQSKLIKAVDNLERRKEDPPKIDEANVYEDSDLESEEFDYEVDESTDDDDAPPRNHTGGKWKPSSPIQWTRQDWNVPPPSFTGGKWKPSIKRVSPPPPSHTKGKWKPTSLLETDIPPPSFTGSKWTPSKANAPPLSHTKGKWKPEEEQPIKPSETKDELDVPLPTYTKGKWIPDNNTDSGLAKKSKIMDDPLLRKSSGTVQYWCRTCNRRLASKTVYERHLKSELHFKRTLQDKELEDITMEKRCKKKATAEIVTSRPSTEPRLKQRNRKSIYLKCQVCRSKVNRNQLGKHLISHYHCRKGDISSNEAKTMVLDNVTQIILQSPFQCSACKFYCNYHKDFLDHWLSDYHAEKQSNRRGYFWCSLCQFKSDDNLLMYQHLVSEEHGEVVAVINRSVPITIRKILPLKCDDCNSDFVLKIALKKHCELKNHKSINLTRDNYVCDICERLFKSNISLKRHRQNIHNSVATFICSVCEEQFTSVEEARKHRSSREHRYKVTGARNRGGTSKKCTYCSERFEDIPRLKQHLEENHKELLPKCGVCGISFALPQELSVHLRTKSCSFKDSLDPANSCDKCPFSSKLTSELLFHKVLHTEPLMIQSGEGDNKKKATAQYKCPLCQKFFPKTSLQAHLRLHTKERPFVCGICHKGFVRKNNWMLHVRNHDRKNQTIRKLDKGTGDDRPFLCSTCGASFKKRSILQQHMTTHSGKMYKCPKSGCVVSARSMAALKQHFVTHSDVKNFVCTICDYRGKTKQQFKRHLTIHTGTKKYTCGKCSFSGRTASHLKRHSRLHTGAKPYACPHCEYKCNSLENLRKHVLSTNKHQGKCIYECKFCQDFQSNFAKEFKVHLVTQHGQLFSSGKGAPSYVAGIYDHQDDSTVTAGSSDEDNPDHQIPKIIVLQNQSTLNQSDGNNEEVFPMFIVTKDQQAGPMNETWTVVGNYSVDEAVPFGAESVFFQGQL